MMRIVVFFLIISLSIHAYKYKSPFRAPIWSRMTSSDVVLPSPGSPKVIFIDNNENKARILLTLGPDATQTSFSKSLELFNEEVAKKDYKVPGFRKGAKLPAMYLYQIFGEDSVKNLCATLMAKDIQDECEKTGLTLVGRGNVIDFKSSQFSAGKPHTIEVEVELWPSISYTGPEGYKGLVVTVEREEFDKDKYESVKRSIQERYKVLLPCEASYKSESGDVAIVNMRGFEKKPDGSRGNALPSVAKGDAVEVPLEKGKFMEGLVEGIIGGSAGETKTIVVKFPTRPSGAGAALSGKEAIFEIEIVSVKKKSLPLWDEALASQIRPGMTFEDLDNEVREAVNADKAKSIESSRNDALAQALVTISTFNRLPSSLIEDTFQQRFQNMLMDFKEQGSTDEQIKEMATPENYEKFKNVSRVNAEKSVKLGLLFRDIAEKENIAVNEAEIKQQLDLLNAQSKQKNQGNIDEMSARDEIENTLLRLKIFDFLASTAKITYVDKVSTTAQS